MWRVTRSLPSATSGRIRCAIAPYASDPPCEAGFTVTLRCPRAARASKGDGRCTSMSRQGVTFSLTFCRYLCYQMQRISLNGRDVAGDNRTMERVRFLWAGLVIPFSGGLGIEFPRRFPLMSSD